MTTQPAPPPLNQFPSIGRWVVTRLPQDWIFAPGFGIRRISANSNDVAANVCLGHDQLDKGEALAAYIERQREMIQRKLPRVSFSGPIAAGFKGAEEAQLLGARHPIPEVGAMAHLQTYVRQGMWIGIATLTAREEEIRALRPIYEAFLNYLYIQPEPAAESISATGQPAGEQGVR